MEVSPEIVQRITEEVKNALAQQARTPASPSSDARILAIFDAAQVDLTPSLQQLDKCIGRGYEITVILSDLAAKLLDIARVRSVCGNERVFIASEIADLQPFTEDFALIVIPILSYPMAAKLSIGMADTPCTYPIFQGALRGGKIIATSNALDMLAASDAPPEMVRLGRNYIKTLAKFGIQFVTTDGLAEAILNDGNPNTHLVDSGHGKRVISASVIANLEPGVHELVYANPAIITPLARDLAVQKGIRLVAKPK